MPTALWNGRVIAQSDETRIVEGNHYFPPDSLNRELLVESDTHSVCGWKGRASYYHVKVDGELNRDAAWYYPDPEPEAADISGWVAFWRGVMIEP